MTQKPSRLLQEADSVVRNRPKQIKKYKSHKSAVIFSVQTGKQKCLRRRTSWKALVSASWKTPIIKIFDRIFFDSSSALSGIIFFHIVYFSFLQLPRWKVSLTWFHQEFLAPAFSACPDPFPLSGQSCNATPSCGSNGSSSVGSSVSATSSCPY